jgi:formimidoylglutamate deiminase
MVSSMVQTFFAAEAMLPVGWRRDVRIGVDAAGAIASVQAGAPAEGAERLAGPVAPGMCDLHCHAFQRAMAGLAERRGPAEDDFWTWRETMYRFVERLTPEANAAIAGWLYAELLKGGYTRVCEFHYLHDAPAGMDAMAESILAAAAASGIGLTLLPVLYMTGDFGGAPAAAGQRRFLSTPERIRALAERIPGAGLAPHSLRAAPPEALKALTDGWTGPIHIHAAEQLREVHACVAWSGKRPVEWLLEHAGVDPRWCLIHATHLTLAELRGLAASGAVAGLCPTTEANLGDGAFRLPDFLAAGGRFGVGSDSNVGVEAAGELAALEGAQRLAQRRRNLATVEPGASIGAALWRAALAGGAQACGQPTGAIAPGALADLVVLDPEHPSLAGRAGDLLLDALVFAPGNPIRDVLVGGRWAVRDGRHVDEERLLPAYRDAVRAMLT